MSVRLHASARPALNRVLPTPVFEPQMLSDVADRDNSLEEVESALLEENRAASQIRKICFGRRRALSADIIAFLLA